MATAENPATTDGAVAPVRQKEIQARMVKAMEMANEICNASSPFGHCGDVARATAIALVAVKIFDELKNYFTPPQ